MVARSPAAHALIRVLPTVVVVALTAACGAGSGVNENAARITRVLPGADHACVTSGGVPTVAWSQLRNPILSEADAAVKDQALVWFRGRWHMLFSYVTNDTLVPGQEHWAIASAQSTDLLHWSDPVPWSEQPGGVASPDLVRDPTGTFVATYDSPPGESGARQARLYFRTSSDLVHWSPPHTLAPELHPSPGQRMIDPALAWTGNGLILAYKVGVTTGVQAFEVAWSPSGSLAGPFRVVGRPTIRAYGDTFENYELLTVDGHWRLVATSNSFDQPWIFTLAGDPSDPSSWLRWRDGYELEVPSEAWNSGAGISSVGYEHANSAFLCEDPADGYAYLTYAGSQELSHFGGWGHAKIGVARSRDLVHWSVPPG